MQLGPKPLSQRCLQKLSFQTPLPKLRHVSEKCEKQMKFDSECSVSGRDNQNPRLCLPNMGLLQSLHLSNEQIGKGTMVVDVLIGAVSVVGIATGIWSLAKVGILRFVTKKTIE